MKPGTRIVLGACALALLAVPATAQVTKEMLLEPPADTWPGYHGDYSGQHFSPLDQINQGNVRKLTLAWSMKPSKDTAGAQSGGTVETAVRIRLPAHVAAAAMLKSTPIVFGGMLYFTAPDHVWAVDARTGKTAWHYFWRTTGGNYLGHRGVAAYGDHLYFGTPDGHLVSLDRNTGKERWHKQIGDTRLNYYASTSPVVVNNQLIVGLSGDAMDVRAWLESRDVETGDLKWKWHVTPGKDEPGAETWPSDFAREHGGGMTWQPVTYDPVLNLIYVTTGNPNPVYAPELRVGDNLYTCSIVALDANTGKMVWYFQTSPNEAWDFDANQVGMLIDAKIDGEDRKLIVQATRNGLFFVLDRTTGKKIIATQLAESVTWLKGFTPAGKPIRDPSKIDSNGGALISPNNGGVQNWTPPAYMPNTGLVYLNASQGYELHYTYGGPDPATGGRSHMSQGLGGYDVSLRAIDIRTGKAKWIHRYAGSEYSPDRPEHLGGLLATAGNLVFAGAPGAGDAGYLVAYDPDNGRQLWHASLPARLSNTPITYLLDGRQYIVFQANDTLYAYALAPP